MTKIFNRITAAAAIIFITFGSSTDGIARAKKEQKDTTTKLSKYQEVFKDKSVVTAHGPITVHLVDDKVYLEFPDSLNGRDFIMGTSVTSTSNPKESTVGSYPKSFKRITFNRADSLILLGTRYISYMADKTDKDIIEALSISRMPATIASFPIIDKTPDNQSSLIDVTSFFTGDKDFLIPKDEEAYNNMGGFVVRTYKYNPDGSYIKGIDASDNSFSIINEMSYNITRKLFTMSTIAKDEPLTATVRCSVFLAPNKDYTPVEADLKANTGRVKVIDYSSRHQGAQIKYYATRWDLSGSRQLTFIADSDLPKTYREAVEAAVEIWNKGFGRKVIKIEYSDNSKDKTVQKDGRIRYIKTPASKVSSSTWKDPATGEIFYADIVINHNVISSITTDAIISLGAISPKAMSLSVNDNLLKGMLTYKIAHEIGKCLGFIVNLSASSVYPTDSLQHSSFTEKYGITPSIMDVVGFNYIAEEGCNESNSLFQDRLGEYDLKSIALLYGNTAIDHNNDNIPGKSFLSGDKGLTYLYVAPRGENEKANPYGLKNDLGDDALLLGSMAMERLYTVVKNANESLKDEDPDLTKRSLLYDNIIERYFDYSSFVIEKMKSDDSKLLRNCIKWVEERLAETARMEELSLMNNSELNTCISDYIATALFESLISEAIKLSNYKEEALDIIHSFVLSNSIKDNVRYRIEELYANALAKDLSSGGSGKIDSYDYVSYNYLNKLYKEVGKRAKKDSHYSYLYHQLEKIIK